MDKDFFKLCVRTYYPFAEFYEFKTDELDVAQNLPKNYWAEPDKQWLGYFHFMHGLRWAKGDLFIAWTRIKGSQEHQEQVLLNYLKTLSTVGIHGGAYILHNVPPVAAIYPPKPKQKQKETLFGRLLGWVKRRS